jgi:RHS repeat-associated protein
VYGPSSTPIAQIADDGTVEYLHADLIGSVRLITGEDGDAVATSTYDEFGNRIIHSGTEDCAFGFTGAWTDDVTELVHLRARDYDPATGQFLTVDPLVDQTRQPYAYTGNNPLSRTDPTGLDFWDDVARNGLAFWAGTSEGVGFNFPMLMDCTSYNKYSNNGFYWAGDVVGVLVAVATLTTLADLRIGTAFLSRTPSARVPIAAPVPVRPPPVAAPVISQSISAQRQARHILGAQNYSGGGYLTSPSDAQTVLNQYHSGAAQVIGMKGNEIVVRSPTVIGYNVNTGSGFASQPTNVFFIKGSTSPSVVPYNPNRTP